MTEKMGASLGFNIATNIEMNPVKNEAIKIPMNKFGFESANVMVNKPNAMAITNSNTVLIVIPK